MEINKKELDILQKEPVLSKYEFRIYEDSRKNKKKIHIKKLSTTFDSVRKFYKLISRD